MAWWRRSKERSSSPRGAAPLDRGATRDDLQHLQDFVATHRGVEAYVEPQTFATETTVVLIAFDGEWTRRRVRGAKEAYDLAQGWGIPAYDAGVVGYPQRMRDWSARNRDRRGTL